MSDDKKKGVQKGVIDDSNAYYPPDYWSGNPDKLLKEDKITHINIARDKRKTKK